MSSRLANASSGRFEVLIGRTFAACLHPAAACRSTTRSFRVLLFAGYFAAAYITVTIGLMLVNASR
jgi:hypothetical protein